MWVRNHAGIKAKTMLVKGATDVYLILLSIILIWYHVHIMETEEKNDTY